MAAPTRTPTTPETGSEARSRPVMLVTFDVPFVPGAAELAVDAAVEGGQALIVVNAARVELGPISLAMKYEYVGTQEVEDALARPAELARELAVDVRRLRVCSPRPVEALLEVVQQHRPALLVVGPDPARMRRRVYRKATRKIRDGVDCLLWFAAES
jgi:hypothetical protein